MKRNILLYGLNKDDLIKRIEDIENKIKCYDKYRFNSELLKEEHLEIYQKAMADGTEALDLWLYEYYFRKVIDR